MKVDCIKPNKMRADKTLFEQKDDNFRSLINQVVDDALDGKVLNYNDIFNIFEQLKDIISECKKTDINLFTVEIEIHIKK